MTMGDRIIDKAWSNIGPGDFIRWATSRFVKYGRVLRVRERSLTAQFIEEAQPTVIPDAKWYYARFKERGPEAEEHLCVIDYSEWYNGPKQPVLRPREAEDNEFVSVHEAYELISIDPKQLRRLIRRGRIVAFKNLNGQWQINRGLLMEAAAKHGWI